jgi:hypothetical protein
MPLTTNLTTECVEWWLWRLGLYDSILKTPGILLSGVLEYKDLTSTNVLS